MFQHYLLPVEAAVYAFPVLAVAIVLPAAFVSYRRRGRAGGWAALVFYTFVFYSLAAFLQTVVPLPADPAAVCSTHTYASHPNLRPFAFAGDIARNGSAAAWPTLLNVALLLPLGFYLRYLWRRSLAASAAIALGASLFFELTQLTGLWFVYPCPYRQFNVDDLLCNTAGAVAGWLIAGPLIRLLPTVDPSADRRRFAARVTFTRRALAYVTDLLGWLFAFTLIVGGLVLAGVAVGDGLLVAIGAGAGLAWFWFIPWATGGWTLGKRAMLLCVVGPEGDRPWGGTLLLRQAILLSPLWLMWFGVGLAAEGDDPSDPWYGWLIAAAVAVAWVWSPLAALLRRDGRTPYEQITGTVNTAILRDAPLAREHEVVSGR
ncbi:VanZ family protein [Phytomonospora sp. NPDC050363]|uniref:VanZ family protein n=1 Tax=Phytomonospora sp. NPDC050363 TaxID=3155642 RepID=UPI0033EA9531